MHRFTIAPGHHNIHLPDPKTYNAGDLVLLTDEQWARLPASFKRTVVIDHNVVPEPGDATVATPPPAPTPTPAWRGTWVAGTSYAPQSIVKHLGDLWIAVSQTLGNEAPSATPRWQLLFSAAELRGQRGFGFEWHGEWHMGHECEPGHVAKYQGALWISLAPTEGHEYPREDSPKWAVVFSAEELRGEHGEQGDPGVTGWSSRTSQAVVENTATHVSILTCPLPPGTLREGTTYELSAYGDLTTGVQAPEFHVRVKLGSTVFLLPMVPGNGKTNLPWVATAEFIVRTAGPTGVFAIAGRHVHGTAATVMRPVIGTINTTAQETIDFTFGWSMASPGASARCDIASVRLVKS